MARARSRRTAIRFDVGAVLSKRGITTGDPMKKLITASLGAAALVASLASVAAAAPTAPVVAQSVRGTHETQQVGVARIVKPQPKPVLSTDQSGIDRTFHPDYSHALSVDQQNAAWNDEINRVMETPVGTGGG
jgi:hypothetical protein